MYVPYTLSVRTVTYLFIYVYYSMMFMLIALDQCKMSNNSTINLLAIVLSSAIDCIQMCSGMIAYIVCDKQITL